MFMNSAELREIEGRLWSAADQLWANTGLKPSEFSTPVLGLIFLRYAEKRFSEAEANYVKGGIKRDELDKTDFQADGVLYLSPKARFSYLLNLPGSENLGGLRRASTSKRTTSTCYGWCERSEPLPPIFTPCSMAKHRLTGQRSTAELDGGARLMIPE